MDRIGGLNYKLASDVTDFQSGMVLSRSEMTQNRRSMRDSAIETEVLQNKLDTLEKAYRAGALEADQYDRAVEHTVANSAEAKRAAADEANARQRAAQVTRSLRTEEEQLADEIRELQQLKPHLDADKYAAAVERLNQRLPENVALEQRRQQQLDRANRRQQLLNQEMQRGEQITRKYETESEKLARELADLEKRHRRGSVSQETYNRGLADINSRLPENVAKEKQREQALARSSRRQDLINREMQRGAQVTRSVETATERYEREVRDLEKLQRRGAITQQTYNRKLRDLNRDMRTARQGMFSMRSIASGMKDEISSQARRLVALSVIYRGFGAIGNELSRIDKVAKTSRKLGLVSDELVGIRLAGEQLAGMMDNQIDMSMQRFTRRVSEAAAGTGEARVALAELNLDAQQMNTAGPTEALRMVADAMQSVESESDRLRIAFKLFDSEGAAMVNVLAKGSAGIDEFIQKGHDLGLTFSDEAAAGVEAANDAITEMNANVQSLSNRLTTGLAPAIGWIADMISGLGDRMEHDVNWIYDLLNRSEIARQAELDRKVELATAEAKAADKPVETIAQIEARQASIDRIQRHMNAEVDRAAAFRKSHAEEFSDLEELRRIAEMNEQERAEWHANEEARAASRKGREIEAEALQNNASPAEAEKLRIMHEQTEELKRQIEEQKRGDEERVRARDKALSVEQTKRDQEERRQKAIMKQQAERRTAEAERIRNAHLTPFEKLVERLQDAKVLNSVGALHDVDFKREIAAARTDFRKSREDLDKERRAPVVRRGSREAYQEITRVMSQARSKEDAIQEEQLAAQRAIHGAIQELSEAIENVETISGVG